MNIYTHFFFFPYPQGVAILCLLTRVNVKSPTLPWNPMGGGFYSYDKYITCTAYTPVYLGTKPSQIHDTVFITNKTMSVVNKFIHHYLECYKDIKCTTFNVSNTKIKSRGEQISEG